MLGQKLREKNCWLFGRIEDTTISFSNFLTFKEHWRPPMVLWRTKTSVWTAISSKGQRETHQFCQCFGIMDAHVPAQKCFRSVHARLSKLILYHHFFLILSNFYKLRFGSNWDKVWIKYHIYALYLTPHSNMQASKFINLDFNWHSNFQ